MATLIKARPRHKFRPVRGDVPKRKVLLALPGATKPEIMLVPYGERIVGRLYGSLNSHLTEDGAPHRGGIGTARHLRRAPVLIKPEKSLNSDCGRLERIARLVKIEFPDSSGVRVEWDSRVRAVMWAEDALKLRDKIGSSCKVEW